ncbi:MAG: nuclear transport factor 2 family protein [Balneolaceae bacterium]|nr:nuclear transport factor 2 family protein [Balneolaceae bacterium]
MKKTLILLSSTLVLFSVVAVNSTRMHHEEEQIKKVLVDGYVNGAFNALNPEAMKETFHEDFAIFSPRGNDIAKYPIDRWAEGVEKRKASAEFNPEDNKWDHKFKSIDVTGKSAAVKIELHHKGEHVYTDYLSLLKFDDGWRVVAKVYHEHEN